ncbi:hypothetical protein MUG87_02330 [Ectobacillus sp. JY-23]|uniref:hypothetical protein n=1 Tax=Ectobacillus sp. JY-23 TaxID=2933872 RepID=UPI001FF0E690|nr:hypothetical protein [Ectobacillus sp. JY-23]UOY92996.1 hypothetical protein MUG87_02330 [Ectobacillus sp. JY-23]
MEQRKRKTQTQKQKGATKKTAPSVKKAKHQGKGRTTLLFTIAVLLVVIYAIFTEEIKMVPNTVQETIRTFLLFGGFYSFLIAIGYILGRKSKR